MPLIDVTEVLSGGDIAGQTFSIIRRKETLTNGRSVIQETTIPGFGSVQPLGDNSLTKEEAFTNGNNGITVWSTVPLRSVSSDQNGQKYQPDLILYQNNRYEIKVLDNWGAFGSGFMKADCVMINYVEEQDA